jgi:predicted nucleotide-binding protein
MAKRQPVVPPQPPSLTSQQALALLKSQRDKGQSLLDHRPITSNDEAAWETVIRDVLTKAFGEGSPNINCVMDTGNYAYAFGGGNESAWEEQRAKDMTKRLTILDGLIDMIQSEMAVRAGSTVADTTQLGNKVFLVHGHDERAIHETARFIEKLGPEVLILRELPNSGMTIIEKFTEYADVAFAVVLLTGDDRGGVANDPPAAYKLRARQNVIFELGFFIGRLSRKRVCVLYQPNVDIPSDYQGVAYLAFDANGAWKLALAKEMKEAGLEIDMNNAL